MTELQETTQTGVEETVETADNATNNDVLHNATEAASLAGAAVSTGSIGAAVSGACLSGACGIASMTAAGGVVGASLAAGPTLIAGAPAYVGAKGINHLAFKDQEGLAREESEARRIARTATNIGAVAGIAGTAAISLSRGVKSAAVIAKLTSVGGLVGGGTMTGAVLLAALPIATAGALGAGAYYWHKYATASSELDTTNPIADNG